MPSTTNVSGGTISKSSGLTVTELAMKQANETPAAIYNIPSTLLKKSGGKFSTAKPATMLEEVQRRAKETPASNAYTLPNYYKQLSGQKFSTASPKSDVDVKIRIAKQLPGPGQYKLPSTTKVSGGTISKSSGLTVTELAMKRASETPAAIYNIPTTFTVSGGRFSKAKPKTMLELAEKHGREIPASNQYNIPDYFSSLRGGKFNMSNPLTDVEIKMIRAAMLPSPGQYKLPDSTNIAGGTISKSSGLNSTELAMSRAKETPGVGTYGSGYSSFAVAGSPTWVQKQRRILEAAAKDAGISVDELKKTAEAIGKEKKKEVKKKRVVSPLLLRKRKQAELQRKRDEEEAKRRVDAKAARRKATSLLMTPEEKERLLLEAITYANDNPNDSKARERVLSLMHEKTKKVQLNNTIQSAETPIIHKKLPPHLTYELSPELMFDDKRDGELFRKRKEEESKREDDVKIIRMADMTSARGSMRPQPKKKEEKKMESNDKGVKNERREDADDGIVPGLEFVKEKVPLIRLETNQDGEIIAAGEEWSMPDVPTPVKRNRRKKRRRRVMETKMRRSKDEEHPFNE